jgi:hypothetical protein
MSSQSDRMSTYRIAAGRVMRRRGMQTPLIYSFCVLKHASAASFMRTAIFAEQDCFLVPAFFSPYCSRHVQNKDYHDLGLPWNFVCALLGYLHPITEALLDLELLRRLKPFVSERIGR